MPRQAFFDFAPFPRESQEREGPNSIEARILYQEPRASYTLHSFQQQQGRLLLDYVAHPYAVPTPRSTEGHNDTHSYLRWEMHATKMNTTRSR